jgi:uncharacterized protein DUF4291
MLGREDNVIKREAVEQGRSLERMSTTIASERYTDQRARWPQTGRHILASYDEASVIVYQAYRPSIGRWAVEHQQLGGPEFGYSRMSWIKPNFLWMMYRSGWGTKESQEITLALRIRRPFFEGLLAQCVASAFAPEQFASQEEWECAVSGSEVRVQWDPDHHPSGAKLERRALQLGLRGSALRAFGTTEILEIIDMSGFVAAQRDRLKGEGIDALITPAEAVFLPSDPTTRHRLGLTEQDV